VEGIWTEGPCGVTGAQQLLDHGPGPGTEPEGNRVWLPADLLDDFQGHCQGCRTRKPLRRGDHVQKAPEPQRGHTRSAPTITEPRRAAIAQAHRANSSAPDCWHRVEVSDKMKNYILEDVCAESRREAYGASVF
jgi:hypothetical protein